MTKSSCANMNLLYASFGTLTLFLIFGGAITNAHRRPCREAVAQPAPDRELKLVHVVMRHGIRSPVTLYPKDPYQGHEFPPNGRGMLTVEGVEGAYQLGALLRERFDALLGSRYNATEFRAESTGVERAQATLMAVNAGLWPPPAEQQSIAALRWMPVPVFMTPLEEDMLLLVAKDCPQYNIERRRVEDSPEVRAELAKYKTTMAIVEERSGQAMRTFDDVGDIYATLAAEKAYGLPLPDWVQPHFDKMAQAAALSFVLRTYNDKLRRLKGGVLLKKIVADWRAKAGGALASKMFLYGGHDSTVANLLGALRIFDVQVPAYAMSVLLQLSYDRRSRQHGVEIFSKNSSRPYARHRLPGCAAFCPLEDVVRLTASVVPEDWTSECATDRDDYKPSPFEGP